MQNLTLRKQYLIPLAIILTVLVLVALLASLLSNGKWKKVNAEVTKYVVTQTAGESGNIEYTVELRYKYSYNNLNYTSTYFLSNTKDEAYVKKLEGKYAVGDSIKIKFNKENPDENEILNF